MDRELKEFLIEVEKQRNGKTWIEQVTAIAGLFGAMAALAGAIYSIVLNIQTQDVQKQIISKQEELDRNDSLTHENARIGRIFISQSQASCASISLGELEIWRQYAACLAKEEDDLEYEKLDTFEFNKVNSDYSRFVCLKKSHINHCRGRWQRSQSAASKEENTPS